MRTLAKLALGDFAVAKATTIAVCVLILGYGGFLFFVRSVSSYGAGVDASRQTLHGKLTIVTEDGSVCYHTLFDNQSSHIVSAEKGLCRESSHPVAPDPQDTDGPLGSIRKALNGR